MYLNEKDCNDIIIKYKKGINKNKLSNEYCVSHQTISNIIERDGRKRIKGNKKYNVDEYYFDKIDTSDKAYWLGFLYADGYVIKKKSTYYSGILIKDLEHIELFKKCIKSEHIIKNATTKNNYSFNIYNKKFSENLIKNGVIPNKTKKICFPDIDNMMISHFIRGFFDGDGSIIATKKTLSFTICCASKDFLESIRENLLINVDINSKLNIYERKDGLYNIITSSIEDINKINKYLYNDSDELYLKRKKNKFDFIYDNHDMIKENIKKYNRERWKKRKNI